MNSTQHRAAELWGIKKRIEGLTSSLAARESGYGDNVVAWLQIASHTSKLSRLVTYGTLTESAGGFTWRAEPSDRLVVIRQGSGARFTVTVTKTEGDALRSGFPRSMGESIAFRLSAPWAELDATYGRAFESWHGWFVDAAGTRVTVDVSAQHDDHARGSVIADAISKERGQVAVEGYEVAFDRELSRIVCMWQGCAGNFALDRENFVFHKDNESWTLSVRDDSTFERSAPTVCTDLTFSGTVTRDGAKVGELGARSVSRQGMAELYELTLSLGAEEIIVDRRTVMQ